MADTTGKTAQVITIKVLRFRDIKDVEMLIYSLTYVPYTGPEDRDRRIRLLKVLQEVKEFIECHQPESADVNTS